MDDRYQKSERSYRGMRRTATAIAMFLLSTLFFYVVGVVTTAVLLFNFLFR